jgi:hypothetical protein
VGRTSLFDVTANRLIAELIGLLLCFTHECVELCFRIWLLVTHTLDSPKSLNRRNFVGSITITKTARKGELRTRY